MAFTAQDVKKLREMTNCGMMDCKKALTEADGDFDKAIEWLREKGKAASVKKAGKVAAEGVSYAAVINGVGVVLEVNSQTDFVAKNEIFQGFVKDLAAVIAEQNPADVEALKACTYPGTDRTVTDVTNDRILSIGENLQIRRFIRPLHRGRQHPLCSYERQGRRYGQPGCRGHRPQRRGSGRAGQGSGYADLRHEPQLCLQR